ncbi:hypothetical protein PYW07_015054 [Mythimna separata]|uniref:Uncharacterized protein n=1 Tax=Mythimna separata TaxID=271217 RepID=A0AAD7YZJ6_MYTSE|nr:hypothetical protein PYW07_015054 [Mythimna separata]
MLRFTILAAVVVFASGAPQTNFIFKNDITPEEAQAYLKQLPFNEPQLSGRTAVLPLVRYDDPRFRSAEAGPTLGHYWKNGKEIENTEDYLEEVYNAAQYHGQDGLGQYAYGYETPESSKVENREGSGLVSGSYVYKVPGLKELVKVRYYADSQGFHQEDNLPKVELKPAEETPELLAARLAFEKAWNEAAEANRHAPTVPPPANNYPQYNYQAQASEQRPVSVLAPQYQAQASEPGTYTAPVPEDNQARDGKALAYAQAQSFQGNQQQQYVQPQQYGQQEQYADLKYGQQQQQQVGPDGKLEEPEPTGPPHGFFYSFTYPVSIIVPKKDLDAQKPIDYDTVGVGSK